MPSGAGRLGFWYLQDRGMISKKTLAFYDPLTYGPTGQTNYYSSGDVTPAQIYATIQAREAALGFTTDFVTSFAALASVDLTQYAHIWDIGYATPYDTNPDDPTVQLTAYLQNGGAMFLLGENQYFIQRDYTILNFVTSVGGGSITLPPSPGYYSVDCTIDPQFLLANYNPTVRFNAPGSFATLGTGTAMVAPSSLPGIPSVMWKTGSLANAQRGAIISCLDVNIFVGANAQLSFVDNLIYSMNLR